MTILDEATDALRHLEAELREPTKGGLDSVRLAGRIRQVRQQLAAQEVRWIGTAEAKRLLVLGSESTVKTWVRAGLLCGRTQPDGRIQVLLDDVLRRREEREGLSAIDDGEEISEHEAQRLLRLRSGRRPRDHDTARAPRLAPHGEPAAGRATGRGARQQRPRAALVAGSAPAPACARPARRQASWRPSYSSSWSGEGLRSLSMVR